MTSVLPIEKSILIVDDHPILRRGLAALISGETDISVFGEAENSKATMALIDGQGALPDLAMVDIRLEESDGIELIKLLKASFPTIHVLVISMHDELVYAERALRAGALGYITKQQLDETVLTAIRTVLKGERYISETMRTHFAEKFIDGNRAKIGDSLVVLTDREIEVFRLIGEGVGTRQIAKQLGISIKTVESHREHIKQKLSINSGPALVRSAVKWVETGDAS